MNKLNSDNKNIWNYKINYHSKINKSETIILSIMYSQIINTNFTHKYKLLTSY